MSNIGSTQERFAQLATIFSILLPLLYVFGYSYEAGYFSVHGISTELFPRTVPEYLTVCLFFLLNAFIISTKLLVYVLLLIFICFILLSICILIISKKSELALAKAKVFYTKLEPYKLKLKEGLEKYNFKILAQPAKIAFLIFFTLYLFLVLMVFTFLVTLIPYQLGKYFSNNEIKEFKACTKETPSENCIALTEYGDVVAVGKIIASSDKYIALYNNGKTTVYSSKDYDIAILNPAK